MADNRTAPIVRSYSEIGTTDTTYTTVTLSNYNSYATYDEANDYLSSQTFSDKWFDAEVNTRKIALIQAGKQLNRITHPGRKTDGKQVLAYPRAYIRDPDTRFRGTTSFFAFKEVPLFVKHAQIEIALDLLSNNRNAGPASRHVSEQSFAVGISQKVDRTTTQLIPDSARAILEYVYSRNIGFGPY